MSEPTRDAPLEGVFLSSNYDLSRAYGKAFAALELPVRIRGPAEVDDPGRIAFALAWHPAPDAFAPYPALAHAGSIAAGVDNLLSCPSLRDDVVITRVVDPAQADMLAAFALCHVVWHQRGMAAMRENQMQGRWRRVRLPAAVDWPVGVLGFGAIGRRVAALIAQAGYPVRAACRTEPDADTVPPGVEVVAGDDSLRRTAALSRVLVNLLPLTASTRNILDATLFDSMPDASVLLQFGRGEHLVEADLLRALEAGKLVGASIDVATHEPLPPEHPFWHRREIFVTPHVAAETSAAAVARQTAEGALAVAAGAVVPRRVDRGTGY